MSRLAIYAPTYGVLSESFIHRHMELLDPGSVTIVNQCLGPRHAFDGDKLIVISEWAEWRRERCLTRRIRNRLTRDYPSREEMALRYCSERFGTDTLLCEYLHLGLGWAYLARQLGLRFFVHAHGCDVSEELEKPGMAEKQRAAYHDATGVIVVNAVERTRLIQIGIPETNIHLIPYGVDLPELASIPRTSDTNRCVAVGRMVGKKGPILMLEAFRRARLEIPSLTLTYIGDGPLMPAVRQFCTAFGLEDCVTLVGAVSHDEVMKTLRDSDMFLQHSWTDPDSGDEEGLPVAILEAMAHGLPVVSTLHAGIPEAVVTGETGFLVPPGDVAEMSSAIVRVASDRANRRRLGEAGRVRCRENFSWERERDSLRSVLGL